MEQIERMERFQREHPGELVLSDDVLKRLYATANVPPPPSPPQTPKGFRACQLEMRILVLAFLWCNKSQMRRYQESNALSTTVKSSRKRIWTEKQTGAKEYTRSPNAYIVLRSRMNEITVLL
jgi:hypothetical protein